MTKSGIDSQNSVSNSPVVPELKADFLERERVDNGDETWVVPLLLQLHSHGKDSTKSTTGQVG